MGPKRKYDDLAEPSSAGSSGGGGVGGDDRPSKAPRLPEVPSPTAQSPSHDQTALPTSQPALQPPGSPPHPADKDAVELEEGEIEYDADLWEEEDEIEDDADSWEEEEDDQDSDEELGGSFHAIPVSTEGYSWKQLLDGKRTYLRPPKDCQMIFGGNFRCPDARPTALGPEEQLSELVRESPDNSIIQEKMRILSKHYVRFRRTRGDGSCFYRALLFSYMEILQQMQDREAEVTRLMECVEMSEAKFSRLKWDEAYFLNPEEYFSSVVSELNLLLNMVAGGFSSEWPHLRILQETFSCRVLSFLRLLTETEIRTEEVYKQYIPKDLNVLQFCWKAVRPLDVEATTIQMRALTYALGIPLRVEVVDESSTSQGVQVKRLDFFHQSDVTKGHLHLTESYLSSSTAPKPVEQGSDDADLLSFDGTPLLTLLCRRGHCDILYRK